MRIKGRREPVLYLYIGLKAGGSMCQSKIQVEQVCMKDVKPFEQADIAEKEHSLQSRLPNIVS